MPFWGCGKPIWISIKSVSLFLYKVQLYCHFHSGSICLRTAQRCSFCDVQCYWSMIQYRYCNICESDSESLMMFPTTVFMQDCALLHIACCVKQKLHWRFTDDRIICRHFPVVWFARSLKLNSCDFWLWGYLRKLVKHETITPLSDLK